MVNRQELQALRRRREKTNRKLRELDELRRNHVEGQIILTLGPEGSIGLRTTGNMPYFVQLGVMKAAEFMILQNSLGNKNAVQSIAVVPANVADLANIQRNGG